MAAVSSYPPPLAAQYPRISQGRKIPSLQTSWTLPAQVLCLWQAQANCLERDGHSESCTLPLGEKSQPEKEPTTPTPLHYSGARKCSLPTWEA